MSEQFGMSQQFILHFFRQGIKLRFEILMKQNYPLHGIIMSLNTYVVKYIFKTHLNPRSDLIISLLGTLRPNVPHSWTRQTEAGIPSYDNDE